VPPSAALEIIIGEKHRNILSVRSLRIAFGSLRKPVRYAAQYAVLRISQKIEAQNSLLLISVMDDVVHYYRYIEDLFSQAEVIRTGIFNTIASEFRLAYLKIKMPIIIFRMKFLKIWSTGF